MKSIRLIIMALFAGAGITAAAQTTNENKQIVKVRFDQWSKGEGSFFDLLTDDVKWTINGSAPLSKTYNTKQQFLDEVINPLNKRLSKKIVPSVRSLYAEGNDVSSCSPSFKKN